MPLASRASLDITVNYRIVMPKNGLVAATVQSTLDAADGPVATIEALKRVGALDMGAAFYAETVITVEEVTTDIDVTPVV